MNRGRYNDHATVAAKIESREKPGPVSHLKSRMLEVDVTPAPAGGCLDCFGQLRATESKLLERLFATVPRIDIEDDNPGNRPCDNG